MKTSIGLTRMICAIFFIILMVLSIAPIPIASALGFYVVVFRPIWFKNLVDKIYTDKIR